MVIPTDHVLLGSPSYQGQTIRNRGEEGLALASLLHVLCVEVINISLLKGVYAMPEYIVAIDHITYYAIEAEDEVAAIDLVLEGQGEEVSSDTRDAYITEYQSSDPRRDS